MSCSLYYKADTGEITQYMEPKLEHSLYNVPNIKAMHLDWGSEELIHTHYVSIPNEELLMRPNMKLKAKTNIVINETLEIKNIPKGTKVEYLGNLIIVNDGFIEISFAEEGVYSFKFTNFPYLEEIINAEVTAI